MDFLVPIPSSFLPIANSSPCSGIVLQSPHKQLPATMHTSGYTSLSGASLVAHTEKNLPAMVVTQVQPLYQEDPLEKEIASQCFSSSTASSRSNPAYSVPPFPFFLSLYPVMHASISFFPVIETSANI